MKINTILVTGASGKTGISVIKSLLAKGYSVRAYVRSASHADLFGNKVEVVIGNLTSARELAHAMDGVTAVYHICPNMHSGEVSIGKRLIRVAKNASIQHFVYHSVLHPQIQEMPHHWNKMRVEGLLFKSGLNYTILQPSAYMQNILQYKKSILEKKVYAVPYNGNTRIGMVELDDVAEAAAAVICQSRHYGGIYELATDETPSQYELAKLISQVVNEEIRFEELSRSQWIKDMRKIGMNDYALTTLVRMFEYYETYGFRGNGTILRTIIGRAPKSLAHFIKKNFS